MEEAKFERGNDGSGYGQPWWEGYGNSYNSARGLCGLRPPMSENVNVVGMRGDFNQQVGEIPTGIPLGTNECEKNGFSSNVVHGPSYGVVVGPYAQQPVVHPHLDGVLRQGRMAVPQNMEAKPVYVNAKQYNGIMRRRQIKAKAELQRKIIKKQKPYLHESRHQHAMRRARGCGGRFLNTKNFSGEANKPGSGGDGTQGDCSSKIKMGNERSSSCQSQPAESRAFVQMVGSPRSAFRIT